MLTKNQILDMDVESFGAEAQGVCRVDGMAVFVPGALPGERVRVRIVKAKSSYAFGRLEEVLSPAPYRQDAPCASYPRCGGCSCQHMDYAQTLEFKRVQVQELLRRVGGVTMTVPPVLGMKDPWHYRNKGAYPIGRLNGQVSTGFYAPRSHDLVPLPEGGCPIQRGDAQRIVDSVVSWMRTHDVPPYDEKTHTGLVRHVVTRTTRSGDAMAVLVLNGKTLPQEASLIEALRTEVPSLKSIIVSRNTQRTNVILGPSLRTLWGADVLEDTLCSLRFQVSPLSFFQVNPEQTDILYQKALEFAHLDGTQTLVDAYCGAGTISLLLAGHAKSVLGIEIVPEAIENAKINAKVNQIDNASFLCGAAEELLPDLLEKGTRPDVVVVDPPRKGCDERLLHALLRVCPPRIVYVSCNPATLARDVGILTKGGYHAEEIACVDMFCWTGGVETVLSLSRKIQGAN